MSSVNRLEPLMYDIEIAIDLLYEKNIAIDLHDIANLIDYEMNGQVMHIILFVAENNGFEAFRMGRGHKWYIVRG